MSAGAVRRGKRREGEGGGAFEIAGHQEPARRQRRKSPAIGLALAQIVREGGGKGFGGGVGRLGGCVGGRNQIEEGLCLLGAGRTPSQRQGFLAPLGVGLGEEGQIEQPFAGIVHDIEIERRHAEPAPEPVGGLVAQGEAQL